MRSYLIFYFLLGSLLFGPSVKAQPKDGKSFRLERKALKRSDFIPGYFSVWKQGNQIKIDSVRVDREKQMLYYYFNSYTTYIPVRTTWINELSAQLKTELGRSFRKYDIQFLSQGRLLQEYIPNAFRDSLILFDKNRLTQRYAGPALVTDLNQRYYDKGLSGSHIALWPSHGLFFDQSLDRWQWQRARLWQTVEDIFPWSFTTSWLVPMLENAGATVLLPRERDTQIHEVIVDNDERTGKSEIVISNGNKPWEIADQPGFNISDTLFPGQNPFQQGTSLSLSYIPGDTAGVTYLPAIPEAGDYAVNISYSKTGQCLTDARYAVQYAGGQALFSVNQCMGAGTWIYLGTFRFNKGLSVDSGSVKISGGDTRGTINTDAIRFGGGMGNIARKGQYKYSISGKPRWMEGSRYYLQYAGMPDSLIYDLSAGKNDYTDDYMSRPEWVNYLIGKSRPQYSDRYRNGLDIPVDMALALHTDAGTARGDTIIGTLGIYSTTKNNGLFPDGSSKLASRDLADIIQTQVVEDVHKLINPQWTRRSLWDKEYSEAWRPVVPTVLLELLSHQNLTDMRYGLDPRFKFIAARSIYKGILKFMATEQGREAIIQPLPPDHMAIEVLEGRKVKISWQDVEDTLEPSAKPNGYKVYMMKEGTGFNQGIYTGEHSLIYELPAWGEIYSFRVTSLNEGGESFPGETLSVSILSPGTPVVLVVNAFDRICAPAFFEQGEMAGIAWWEDEGVTDGPDMSFSGHQYNFDRNSQWLNDDSQGWGASNADGEATAVAGNNFSFPLVHGKALRDAGYSFVSVSDEVFISPGFNINKYTVTDLIFGEERGTPSFNGKQEKDFRVFTPGMISAISRFTRAGNSIFISGAYVGTDMIENADSAAIKFASEVLHYTWRTGHATTKGIVNSTNQGVDVFPSEVKFNTEMNPEIYRVESPDGIEPFGTGAFRICRYASGNVSAGIAYRGDYKSVILGFPFETITKDMQREEVMGDIMKFLTKENGI